MQVVKMWLCFGINVRDASSVTCDLKRSDGSVVMHTLF